MRNFRVVLLSISMIAACWGFVVSAQNSPASVQVNAQRIEDLDKRVVALEDNRLDSRLVRLEATADVNRDLLIAIFTALMGLTGEAGYRLTKRKTI